VVDAMLDLLGQGELRPTAARIAERAGVALRSVFQHFADLEALFAAAADRQLERVSAVMHPLPSSGPLAVRLDAFVEHRRRIWETIAPVRRAALLWEPFSPEIAGRLVGARAVARAEVEDAFAPELARRGRAERHELADALTAAASWSVWEQLRRHQRLSVERAARVVARTLASLLGREEVADLLGRA
jgi:TetR/AcrR family transcriptional regulator of autoinduction and epiphytic fitness